MDAADGGVADGFLYKASSDLVAELQTKLPQLIWHDGKTRRRLRTHVLFGKCEELSILVSDSDSALT